MLADSVDGSMWSIGSDNFKKKSKNLKKNQKKYPEAWKIPKNSKENLVKFLASNSFSRYI